MIGTSNAGNTFPGAVRPFGMLARSPENSRSFPNDADQTRTAAPGGYLYDHTRNHGFSVTLPGREPHPRLRDRHRLSHGGSTDVFPRTHHAVRRGDGPHHAVGRGHRPRPGVHAAHGCLRGAGPGRPESGPIGRPGS
ncbi:MAG: hypothetical protein ACRDTM_12645 [Micromonosporaceae bacterium]